MNETIVVGAGPAGSATAIELARLGHDVLLLDAAHFPRRKACAEYVSPGGAAILQNLGLFETLGGEATGRWLDGMSIVAPSGNTHLVGYRGGDGLRRGLSIARWCLDAALVDVARHEGVCVREGCRVSEVTFSGARATGVRLNSGEMLQGRMIVGADGHNSVVARAAGPPINVRWPRRLGLVAHFTHVEWPETRGEMRVGAHGYVGVAPLDHDGSVTVGLVRPMPAHGPANDLLRTELRQFAELDARLAKGQQHQPVIGTGPMARRVRATAGPGWLLVGDAAGFFDPFTGEGIFRALRGAQIAARHVHTVLSGGTEDPAAYVRARKHAFAAKERLTRVIQVFVQTPPLLELAIERLNRRPTVARHLGNMLGDLEPASLRVVPRLLAP